MLNKNYLIAAIVALLATCNLGLAQVQQCPNSLNQPVLVHPQPTVVVTSATPVAYHSQEMDIIDTAVGAGNFTTLATALKVTGLVDALKGDGPFTVFAPSDAAFSKLPEGTLQELLKEENRDKLASILKYHVVSGKVMAADVVKLEEANTLQGDKVKIKVVDNKVMIDGATVTTADIKCSNGVIHVIDSVILPGTNKSQGKNIVETAVAAGQFNTLAAALKAAGLVETLSGKGPFTVFAPTDEAFKKLPAGTVEELLKPENRAKLTAILTYHVVSGKVMAADVVKLTKATTVQGQDVAIKVKNGTVMINDASVTTADVGASNGVIHVIDSVIIPSDK